MKTALLLVDPLNDFADPKGALYVKDGEKIIPLLNELLEQDFDYKVLIQDWHPKSHGSFASTHNQPLFSVIELNGIPQVMWSDHCVQNTWGAEPHTDLNKKWDFVIQKGMNTELDSYSAFYENDQKTKTGLTEKLKSLGVDTVYVVGLATDYCVKFTVIDALKDGFKVILNKDAIKGVNINPVDSENAIKEMKKSGSNVVEWIDETHITIEP
jgi:nicotinamidase/pyrazinamidase